MLANVPDSIIYRAAKLCDCNSVLSLNLKWCKSYEDNLKDAGFLKNPFSFIQIQSLIADEQVAVAETQGEIVGYYLSNSLYENGTTKISKSLIPNLISIGKLREAKYAYHSQVGVDSNFMRRGISKNLLKELKHLVGDRFDYLVGLIDKENLNSREASLRSGWTVVAQIESGSLAITATNEY